MSANQDMIEAHLEHLRRAGCTEATLRGRREILYRLDRAMPYGVGEVSRKDIADWLYQERYSRNTKATYYAALRRFYSWATDPRDPWIGGGDPTEGLEKCTRARGTARPVTNEELRKILTEAAEPFRLWALIAAYQGLRAIEISRLDREHVTEQHLIVVRGKGDRPRLHDTHPDVWAAVRGLPKGPVALTREGDRADAFYVSIQFSQYTRYHLRMPGVGLHRLRHWLGSTVQREHRDIRVTMAVLGHASLSSTQVYTDASDEQQRAARATLPRFAG